MPGAGRRSGVIAADADSEGHAAKTPARGRGGGGRVAGDPGHGRMGSGGRNFWQCSSFGSFLDSPMGTPGLSAGDSRRAWAVSRRKKRGGRVSPDRRVLAVRRIDREVTGH